LRVGFESYLVPARISDTTVARAIAILRELIPADCYGNARGSAVAHRIEYECVCCRQGTSADGLDLGEDLEPELDRDLPEGGKAGLVKRIVNPAKCGSASLRRGGSNGENE
jgi:hypothetical protein